MSEEGGLDEVVESLRAAASCWRSCSTRARKSATCSCRSRTCRCNSWQPRQGPIPAFMTSYHITPSKKRHSDVNRYKKDKHCVPGHPADQEQGSYWDHVLLDTHSR